MELLVLAVVVGFVALRRHDRAAATGGVATASVSEADGADEGPEMEVELERVTVGDDLSVATAGLDPTLVADVLELNEDAADLVDAAEEGFVRQPIETATGTEVPDVEAELARRIRESEVPETALDELETLGGLFGFGDRRRRRDRREDAGDGDAETADE